MKSGVGRQARRWNLPLNRVQKSSGGDRMSDYELIMIFLAILTLIVMVAKKGDK